jgi:hypothetical protein
MASGRFALRAEPHDPVLRQHRARLALNVAHQVLALREAHMRLTCARDPREALGIVERMIAEREQQVDAAATEPGHA